jgi:phosphoribosylglycinamide formyltransferase-1
MKVVILASGEGTNAENILSFSQKRKRQFEIRGLVSDQPNAGVLNRARKWNIPVALIEKRHGREAHEKAILSQISSWGAEWVFLAGYMRILGHKFLSHFYDPKLGVSRIINIHPSLLPQFKGLKAYERAFEANVPQSGVSVHFVNEGIDTGPLILQKSFPRKKEDSFETFQNRGKEKEFLAYREAIDIICKRHKEDLWSPSVLK